MRVAALALALAILIAGVACGAESTSDSDPEALTRIVLQPKGTVSEDEVDLSIETMQRRLDKLRVPKPTLKSDGEKIELILPSDQVARSLPVLLRRGLLEFFDLQGDLTERSLDDQGFPRPSAKPILERAGTVLVTCTAKARYCPGVTAEPEQTSYYLFRYDPDNKERPIPEMTGEDLELDGTRQDFDTTTGEPIVLMQFTKEGARKFQQITLRLSERGRVLHNRLGGYPEDAFQQFAIVLDRELYSAPTIDYNENPAGIPGDSGAQITGIGPLDEARELALVLQTGALPVEYRVVSKEEARK